jgi:hypothetical protein
VSHILTSGVSNKDIGKTGLLRKRRIIYGSFIF